MSENYRNAFVATRPPGHHAGIFGKTYHPDDSRKACSNGFCYLNNIAIAAAYLKNKYREKINKIAIIDFDVHHGNGTQEIIEAMIKPKRFTIKTDVSPFSNFEITSTHYKPWLDFEDGSNVLFSSVHLYSNGPMSDTPSDSNDDQNSIDPE